MRDLPAELAAAMHNAMERIQVNLDKKLEGDVALQARARSSTKPLSAHTACAKWRIRTASITQAQPRKISSMPIARPMK